MSAPEPLPWIANLESAVHGATTADGILDFSANGNVVGPSPAVWKALRTVDLGRYPDRDARALGEAISERHGISADHVVAGNGSTELIWALARAYLAPGDRALVVSPTYGEYAVASHAAGASVDAYCSTRLEERAGGAGVPGVDLQALREAIRAGRPKIAWLCHPNNPTGRPFPIEGLPLLVAEQPGVLWVVDEAYLTFTDCESALALVASGAVVVLRSLTKDLGLAGLRLGYAVAPDHVAEVLRRVIPPWSVSGLAQAGGIAALADVEHFSRVRAAVMEARTHLIEGLHCIGLAPFPSVTNFFLVSVGAAAATQEALMRKGLAVRDCTSFGLADCIRIGVRPIGEQARLLDGLQEVLQWAKR
jgi:histidinol-phosphate aminotransferase